MGSDGDRGCPLMKSIVNTFATRRAIDRGRSSCERANSACRFRSPGRNNGRPEAACANKSFTVTETAAFVDRGDSIGVTAGRERGWKKQPAPTVPLLLLLFLERRACAATRRGVVPRNFHSLAANVHTEARINKNPVYALNGGTQEEWCIHRGRSRERSICGTRCTRFPSLRSPLPTLTPRITTTALSRARVGTGS